MQKIREVFRAFGEAAAGEKRGLEVMFHPRTNFSIEKEAGRDHVLVVNMFADVADIAAHQDPRFLSKNRDNLARKTLEKANKFLNESFRRGLLGEKEHVNIKPTENALSVIIRRPLIGVNPAKIPKSKEMNAMNLVELERALKNAGYKP